MSKTVIFVAAKPVHVRYQCPHCDQVTAYDTDSIPLPECHRCLKPLGSWDVVKVNDPYNYPGIPTIKYD